MSGGRGYEGGRTRMVSDICGDRTQNALHTSSNIFSLFVFQLTTLFLSGNKGMLLVIFWDTTLPSSISMIMVFFVVLHSDPGDTECVSRACTESMEKSILFRTCFITHILLTPELYNQLQLWSHNCKWIFVQVRRKRKHKPNPDNSFLFIQRDISSSLTTNNWYSTVSAWAFTTAV